MGFKFNNEIIKSALGILLHEIDHIFMLIIGFITFLFVYVVLKRCMVNLKKKVC